MKFLRSPILKRGRAELAGVFNNLNLREMRRQELSVLRKTRREFCNFPSGSENGKSKTTSGFIIRIFSEFWASFGVQFRCGFSLF